MAAGIGRRLLTRNGKYARIHLLDETQHATVAQLVEQRIRNAQVRGSSPLSSSKMQPDFDDIEIRLF